jgi:hypothetical protein
MKEAFGDWPLDPTQPDFDMLQHIRDDWWTSYLFFQMDESHEDDHAASLPILDHWGLLNVETARQKLLEY